MKWLAVVNAAAGRAREAEQLWLRVERAHPGLERVLTDGPGSGIRIARASGQFDGLIVIGGDGTVSECLTGMDLPRQRLAVLPAGHGNCLVRDLGLQEPDVALAALQRTHWRALDLMEVAIEATDGATAHRICASTVATGYVTDVVTTGRTRLPGLGHAAYAVAALFTAPQRFRAHTTVAGEAGPRSQTLTGLVVNNTSHLANFRAFPVARLDDGLLDVMWQDVGWWRQQLHNGAVLVGSGACGPRAMRQTTRLHATLELPRAVMLDGELFEGVVSLDVACRRGAVLCRVPAP